MAAHVGRRVAGLDGVDLQRRGVDVGDAAALRVRDPDEVAGRDRDLVRALQLHLGRQRRRRAARPPCRPWCRRRRPCPPLPGPRRRSRLPAVAWRPASRPALAPAHAGQDEQQRAEPPSDSSRANRRATDVPLFRTCRSRACLRALAIARAVRRARAKRDIRVAKRRAAYTPGRSGAISTTGPAGVRATKRAAPGGSDASARCERTSFLVGQLVERHAVAGDRLVPDRPPIVGQPQDALHERTSGGGDVAQPVDRGRPSSGCARSSIRMLRAVRASRRTRQARLGRAPELVLLLAGAGRGGRRSSARSLASARARVASGAAAAAGASSTRPRRHRLRHLARRAEAIGRRLRERAQQRLIVRAARAWRAARVGGGGASPRCWPTRSGPRNGGRPVSASNSVAPSAYRSAAAPIGALLICSGDMYASVPRNPPDCVWPKSARCAPPKSPSFALPATSKKMFAGFTSR